MAARTPLPEHVEAHRDRQWCREESRRVGTPGEAERFVERAGFAACLTDARRPGPSLYVAVCGRRDAVLPRNVQHDAEASLAWRLKDEVLRRGQAYYAKLGRGRAMFVAPRLVPAFHALWGVRKADETRLLGGDARAVLRVLRAEWEMATADLREESGVRDGKRFAAAMDALQAAMLVVPSEVLYEPRFTYIWTLAVGRFPALARSRMSREAALREVARAFLDGAGMTVRGELARVAGLSRQDAGLGNRALVADGTAVMLGTGVYALQRMADAGH
ncbi:hypothetical protein TBR22_A48620 [Luteitalea sp. TBR-22]|uniref:AlkZ-related protein n=1 Tax=Luteitalea sp. TBR-22 TaxID=2802971 RepID=UPI001AF4960D|nr:hypothetical protein [Luteitalea sp. TBR-22]BCS35628.1 hypothetical protein TBR22_A48620 [Luteitalea sp. TBR-22]